MHDHKRIGWKRVSSVYVQYKTNEVKAELTYYHRFVGPKRIGDQRLIFFSRFRETG
jgi:hypothetical protein